MSRNENDIYPLCPTYFKVYFGSESWTTKPQDISEPGYNYTSTNKFRHKDSLGRVWTGPEDDRYLSATDGRLAPLVVQATKDTFDGPANSTWVRTDLVECTPGILQIVYSLLGPQLRNGSAMSIVGAGLAWIPSCLAISLLSVPGQKEHGISQRLLRPRRLVLRQDKFEGVPNPVDVEKWESNHETLDYIFICYSTKQFKHRMTQKYDEENGISIEEMNEHNRMADEDIGELHHIGEDAARKAGVAAYWLAGSCMESEEGNSPSDDRYSKDVYRISDIVRGAHSLVVAIGPSREPSSEPSLNEREMLRQLGERMWTFPEVLLSPTNQPITLYARHTGTMRNLSKRDFTNEAWGDTLTSRQLVDHYEGTIILSPLELVSLALQCFPNRMTTTYCKGDLSYALMGLLRRRPDISKEDSSFEAFCRLSLANDSDQLIERLICMFPKQNKEKDIERPWHEIDDTWDSNLWDIRPHCQVVGLGGDDTIILSGAMGAPIHWKSFEPVNILMRNTLKRQVARLCFRSSPVWLVSGISLLAGSRANGRHIEPLWIAGLVIMGIYLIVMLASPYLLYSLYSGKNWAAQPWIFGFEGYMKITDIERLIFGIDLGRLRWSPFSSDLSIHDENQFHECEGKDPTIENPTIKEFVSAAGKSKFGDLKLFTLVDTNTMTVTLFRAVRPPVAMLLCGSEGGMERALLCSYDWKTQTLCRETVLRVQTVVLEQISRVDRFRLALKRPKGETARKNASR
ncbi:hypothetical protein N7481_006501 [Penicillium waksmanii]|uniref:uncharacterized protein n=1 Tax=Penicillium waksmanii TaxID=69791 RepID=UPI002549839A|nr:uncharacterized protein N7481_006501 [Penicillium waksmanii]KAJ5984402.1 hypothetical protein N7481_006501 [Penicillium waksmanii]